MLPVRAAAARNTSGVAQKMEDEMRQRELPSGRFRYEPGSYGSPNLGYMPSIICYKETGSESWTEHFCLVKSDVNLTEEDSATAIAKEHLAAASRVQGESGGDPREFALSLRHEGYKAVSDFRIVRDSA